MLTVASAAWAAPAPEDSPSSRLHRTAIQAARRGSCEVVKAIGRQLRASDPVYFRDRFATDPTIVGCRSRPSSVVESRPFDPPPVEPAPVMPAPVEQPYELRPVHVTYHWPLMLLDLAAGGLVAIRLHSADKITDPPLLIGVTTYLLGAPLVHALHGRNLRAGISLATRILVPLGAGALAYYGRQERGFGRGLVALVVGGAAAGGAMIADWMDASAIVQRRFPLVTVGAVERGATLQLHAAW
jgi:hypothetical protein